MAPQLDGAPGPAATGSGAQGIANTPPSCNAWSGEDHAVSKAWSRLQALSLLAGWRAELIDRDGATILVASRWSARTRAFTDLDEAEAWIRQVAPHVVSRGEP